MTPTHNTEEIRDHKRTSDNIPKIIALSFFSGAMGLDIGMQRGGIDTILACECNKYCRMTIAKNRPEMALIGDINDYSAKEILQMAKVPAWKKVDVIFGGPPCQSFSTAGKRRGLEDDRGNAFLRYVEIVESIRPSYVVIENVRGLLSAPSPCKGSKNPERGGALCAIIDRLEKTGYTVSFELYNSANYGAPQIRERIVIIGKLGNKKVPYLFPTNSNNPEYGLPRWNTFGDVVSKMGFVNHHHIDFPEKRLKYYRMLKEGENWKNLPADVQAKAMGNKLYVGGGKTGFFRRLSFSRPSPTLVTNPAMPATDLCHPTEDRPLSIEEYRCIQGFPPDWEICGSIREQYRQIGNAVPVLLGEAIARTIISDMQGKEPPHIENFPYSRYKNTSDKTWKFSSGAKVFDCEVNIAESEDDECEFVSAM